MDSGAQRTEQRYERGGLAIIDRPDGSGRPRLVIVHGGMDRASSFTRMARRVADRGVRRYDRRGYGRSQPGRGVELGQHVEDLVSVIGDEPVLIFGHSIGGTIALAATAIAPKLILGVCAYESPMPWLTGTEPRAIDPGVDPSMVAESFMIEMVGERVWNRLPPRTREARRGEGAALIADLEILRGTPPFDPVDIACPVLIACGAASGSSRRDAAAEHARLLGAGLAEVESADHGIHFTDPGGAAGLVGQLAAMVVGERSDRRS